ncbi:MAG: hypothetical protein AB1426_10970 [Bacillota bacterium]
MVKLDDFLDRELGDERKDLMEKKRQASTHISKLEKSLREGDLEQAERTLGWLETAVAKQLENLARLKEKLPTYDVTAYLAGEFDADFLAACRGLELQVTGTFPAYEVFPFHVRVYPERRTIEVNERVVRCLRPKVLAAYLKAQKNNLYKEAFNPTRFLDILANAYDTILAVQNMGRDVRIQKDLDVSLVTVYERLTPLPAQRRQYPRNMFAFDLHRLYVAGVFNTSDNRRLVLGDTRARGRSFVIYDTHGREQRFGSLRFTSGGEL